ncbi:MAG: XRE family transcriptional regulator [Pseudomonadota bacterium]|nr:XRE family transcriptional regulator [Pseudomonadota bacterium]
MFNPERLLMARKRKGLTAKALSELADITTVTISRIEKGANAPDEQTVRKIAAALGYPESFFYQGDLESLDTDAVSFRSLSKMTAKEKNAALTAGRFGLALVGWVEERFSLPSANLIDLSHETNPEVAARLLRQHWNIGVKPIGNVVHLLEAQGVRFLSLAENTASVDAYSFWKGGKPYVYLNSFKSAERSIFDTAHELGHLVLHCHGHATSSKEAEREANAFASAFLMPREDVISHAPRFITTDTVIKFKKRWRVSAFAMAYRFHALGLISEWQYKSICIELSRRGFRTGEPGGIEREQSAVWPKIFARLWAEKVTKHQIAAELSLPTDEVSSLVDGLTVIHTEETGAVRAPLQLVK